jgi:hypothetical protein
MQKLETLLENIELPDIQPKQYGIGYLMDCCHNLQPFDCFQCQNQLDEMTRPIKTDFFPTSTGFGIGYKDLIPPEPAPNFFEKNDIERGSKLFEPKTINFHDTFKTDRYDNLYGGHSTVNTPSWKKRLCEFDEEF